MVLLLTWDGNVCNANIYAKYVTLQKITTSWNLWTKIIENKYIKT